MGGLEEIPRKVANTFLDIPGVSVLDPGGTAIAKGVAGPQVINQGGGATAAADTPKTLLDPTQMPTLADQRNVKRKSMATQLARKGRASTILTQDDSLGASG